MPRTIDETITAAATSVAVTSVSLADITGATLPIVHNYNLLQLELSSAGGGATLTDFAILVQAEEDGSWYTYINGTDWQNTAITVKPFVSGDGTINLCEAEEEFLAYIVLPPCFAVKCQASVAAGTATLTVRLRARRP